MERIFFNKFKVLYRLEYSPDIKIGHYTFSSALDKKGIPWFPYKVINI